jgi:hypothetical protein
MKMDKKELENAKQLLESELSEACVINGLSEAVANSLLSDIMDAFNRFLSSQPEQEEKFNKKEFAWEWFKKSHGVFMGKMDEALTMQMFESEWKEVENE